MFQPGIPRLGLILCLAGCTPINASSGPAGEVGEDGAVADSGDPPADSSTVAGSGGMSEPAAGNGGSAAGGGSGSGGTSGAAAGSGGEPAPAGAGAAGTAGGGVPDTCTVDAALRCDTAGGGVRSRCTSGLWIKGQPCAANEACRGAGECVATAAACVGQGGKSVCVGATLLKCGADAAPEQDAQCGSERLCQQSLASGRCAICSPGDFRCSGSALEPCSADGSSWDVATKTCAAGTSCDAKSGTCLATFCLPGAYQCAGDQLQRCNDAGAAFTDVKACAKGLCDRPGGQCDVCLPGGTSCDSGKRKMCAADGQSQLDAACPTDRPVCTGNGSCVQCDGVEDCRSDNACLLPACNRGTGSCGTTAAASGTPCSKSNGSSGVCNGAGGCVDCTGTGTACSLTGLGVCKVATCSSTGICMPSNAPEGTSCNSGGGRACTSGGTCVQCVGDAQCASGEHCDQNRCVPNQSCGNGTREGSEACDDGDRDNTDECLIDCKSASCGDGYIRQAGREQCDPGDSRWAPLCNSNCRLTTYGTCDTCSIECTAPTDTCSPGCAFDTTSSCPDVAPPWSRVCHGLKCYIACQSGTCPQGLICASNQQTLDSAGNVVSRDLCVGKLPPE